MLLAGPVLEERFQVDQFVERLRGDTISIPQDGWSEAKHRGRWQKTGDVTRMTGPAAGRYEAYGRDGYLDGETYDRGVFEISPNDVVSNRAVKPYDVLPGEIGLKSLVEKGVLVAAGTPEFEAIYDQWDKKISAPFQSRFYPNFRFGYKVDYLVLGPTRLPSGLQEISFLIGSGVERPDQGSNRPFSSCLFFADERELPTSISRLDDPRCDRTPVTRAISKQQSALSRPKSWLQELWASGNAAPEICRFVQLDDDVSLLAVVLSEGDRKRYLNQGSRRRIDINIQRPRKVALYVDISGGRTDWHVSGTDQTEIVGMFTRRDIKGMKHKVVGLWDSVEVQSLNGVWLKDDKCRGYSPSYNAHLGGPGILQLDESLKALLGKPIDSLIRETDDGSWPRNLNGPEAARAKSSFD